ncbi:MAG: hypothetical protein NZ585_03710 [Chloracidobacterium sp.]|nr:hypothetical protein [Chloracidobacterium sp.]MDW8217149.1 secretin N-terminal domain-containing protein [Acidobacteriota bacterium]
MRFTSLRFTLALCFLAAMACAAAAQSEPAAATEASGASGRQTLATPGIIVRMLEVKHRKPSVLAEVLRDLMTPQGYMRAGDEFNVLVVRDTPEGLARVEEALQKLDRPALPDENFEVSFYFLKSSETPTDRKRYPPIIEPVVRQLESSLPFRGYEYLGTTLSRTTNGGYISTSTALKEYEAASGLITVIPKFTSTIRARIDVVGKSSDRYIFNLSNCSVALSGEGYGNEQDSMTFRVLEGEPVCIATQAARSENFFAVIVIKRLKLGD